MNAGKLDRRVKLYSPAIARSSTGQQIESFSLVGEVWAQFKDGKGSEGFEADQKKSITHVAFIIRYRSDVKPNWELEENSQRYQITAIQEVSIPGVSRQRFQALFSKRKF